MKKFNLFKYSTLLLTALTFTICGCSNEKHHDANTGGLLITTAPSGAEVIIYGKKYGVTPFKRDKVTAKNYLVKLQKNGFETQWKIIKVKRGEIGKLNVVMSPMSSSVLIESNPTHAQVSINGQLKGETPLVIPRLKNGEYSAKIEKTGYAGREVSWKIENNRPQKIMVDMLSNTGKVKISSVPGDAHISIDGRPRGITPFAESMEEGKHKVTISKQGYSTIEDYIQVKRNAEEEKTFTLNLLPGSIEITTTPTGTSVFINNKPYGNSPITAQGIQPGKYTVRVAAAGFDPESKEIEVRPGEPTKISFKLSRNTGGLDLVIDPPGTTVYLNGKRLGITEKDEDQKRSKIFKIRNLSAGTYIIKIAHKRGQPAEKIYKLEVTKGKITRSEPMKLWVANTEIKLTGGNIFQGVLIYETKDKIMFSPQPGISHEFNRTELEYLKPLKEEDE